MVDRMYIGHIPDIGAIALTGIGICSPILILIAAFSSFVGAGGAPLVAFSLGQQDKKTAERLVGNGVVMLLFFSIVLTTVFMLFKEPMLYAFGASDSTIIYAKQYLDIYLMGTVFVQLALGLNPFISCQGKAMTAMTSVMIGAALNIGLDPLFIFVFDMGVKGAALATIISQAVSSVWIVSFLISKRSVVRIKKSMLKPDWRLIGKISSLGISPFIMQSTESMIGIAFNTSLKLYGGDLYVGSMTIMQSVMQLAVIPISGFTQGTQSIISYNFGAGNRVRIKKAFRIILIVCVSYAMIMCVATTQVPELFAEIFSTDSELIRIVGKAMPIYMAGMGIFGIQMACQSAFMGMGQAKISLFLALLRKIILLIPLVLILPRFFGLYGIYWAEPISDIVAASVTGTLFLTQFNRILKKNSM